MVNRVFGKQYYFKFEKQVIDNMPERYLYRSAKILITSMDSPVNRIQLFL
jgi:hypothetical protein